MLFSGARPIGYGHDVVVGRAADALSRHGVPPAVKNHAVCARKGTGRDCCVARAGQCAEVRMLGLAKHSAFVQQATKA